MSNFTSTFTPQSFALGSFLLSPLGDDPLRLHPGVRVTVLPSWLVLQGLLYLTGKKRSEADSQKASGLTLF